MAKTKHELILQYIEGLSIGDKVSVRQVAKAMEVSEGTAYRAIKQAENEGLVSSIPKVGTIRIEKAAKKQLEDLTLQEIAIIVEGSFLCGESGAERVPKAFVTGYTVEELTAKRLDEQTLVISGSQEEIQRLALKRRTPLMLTGGSRMSKNLLALAESQETPVIVTPYDTFVAISMINKAIYERLVRQDLVRIGDIMKKNVVCLNPQDTVADWHELTLKSGHSRFPVVNGENLLLGVVTPLDVAGLSSNLPVGELMITEPLVANPDQLVTHLSRLLVWEECELVPVVDEENVLVGVVSRQDIIQALQQMQKQPQFGETIDNLALSGFKLADAGPVIKLSGKVTQFMLDEQGVASIGALTMIMSNAASIAVRKTLKLQSAVESFTYYRIQPVDVDQHIEVSVTILSASKRTCQVEVAVDAGGQVMAKGLLTLRAAAKK